jgi:hypothetical protein
MDYTMTHEQLRGLYLEALDASTGYSFTISELSAQVEDMSYEDMKKAYEEMPAYFKFD